MRILDAKTVIFLGVIHAATNCYGEDSLPAPLPCSKWVRFEIVLGRLTASHPRCRKNQRFATEKPNSGIEEVLTFASQSGVPSIHWQRKEPAETFALDLECGNVVSLRRTLQVDGRSVSLDYEQPRKGPVSFTVEDDGETTKYEAESLWHLFLLTPVTCRQHLMPLLERLRPHWQLELQADRLRSQLLALAKRDWRTDHKRLDELVEQLASDHFQTRNHAERELRGYGFAVVSYLRQRDTRQLTSEQQSRLQSVQQSLRVEAGDTPYRVARWLSEDKEIWLSLLAHGEASVRQSAAIRLSKLCNRPIDFDPHAPGSERRLQIDRLLPLLATD